KFLACSSLGKQKSRGLNKIVHTIIDQTCLVPCCRRADSYMSSSTVTKMMNQIGILSSVLRKKKGYYNTTITSFNMKFYRKYINYAIR
ncbi:hypothetical protein EJD97_006482, partial [Solanum chilense]